MTVSKFRKTKRKKKLFVLCLPWYQDGLLLKFPIIKPHAQIFKAQTCACTDVIFTKSTVKVHTIMCNINFTSFLTCSYLHKFRFN